MRNRRVNFYKKIEQATDAVIVLNIRTTTEYRTMYKSDSRLPAHPSRVYSESWISWPVFLGGGAVVEKYKTIEEASAAAVKLNILSGSDYKKRYKENPRLMSAPSRSFASEWINWGSFLKIVTGKYRTLAEASLAAQNMRILSYTEYKNKYCKDLRLRSQPEKIYESEWTSWTEFLGLKPTIKYATLEEASAAAKRLGIITMSQYHQYYKQDPRLVYNPCREYSTQWVEWKEFLGTGKAKYRTYFMASTAAVRLGILTRLEYAAKYKNDKSLVAYPENKYKNEWKSWYDFLKQESPCQKYKTLQEASSAVSSIGISSQQQYHSRYKEDPRLPSTPAVRYSDEWVDWFHFLQKEKYPYYKTLQEASFAAIALNIKNTREYAKRFSEDEKLISIPESHYKNWTTWKDFLNTHVMRYELLKDASSAALKLSIGSAKEYNRDYKLDNKLPANPASFYAEEWHGWHDFLDLVTKYTTIDQASNAAAKLDIKSPGEYSARYEEDPKLFAQPKHSYVDSWVSWDHYLQLKPKLVLNDGWQKVVGLYLSYQHNISLKRAVICNFYVFYFSDHNPCDQPSDLLNVNYEFDARRYEAFILDQSLSAQKRYHGITIKFFDWVLETYCTDEGRYEVLVLPGFRNPLKTLLRNFNDLLPDRQRLQQSNKPVLPLSRVESARNYLFPFESSSFKSTPVLQDLFSADWLDIKKAQLNYDDDDCVWRIKPGSKNKFQIWSPVRAVALFTLLRMPLRGQQVLWLYSGEADKEIPKLNSDFSIEWIENKLALSERKRNVGFITRKEDNELGMFVSTNKTSAASAGYHVPYMPHDLATVIIRLRNWQMNYNPLRRLTKWSEIDLPREMNENIKKARGANTFLFRDPLDKRGGPYLTKQVFARYLPELLFRTQAVGDNIAWIEGSRFKSRYTPHSMRTSLITAYVVDGGIPIHIISKFVGHDAVVMTIYYTKIEEGKIRAELCKAEKIALSKSPDRIHDLLMSDQIEKARGELFSKDTTFFNSVDQSWPKSSFQVTDKGICAMGGGGCDKGGVDDQGNPTDEPVPIGYLGKRNCPRCRFFITGPAFLGGLVALCNEILLEIDIVSAELAVLEEVRNDLKDEKYDIEVAGEIFVGASMLNRSESDCEEKTMKIDVLFCDFAAVNSLMNKCKSILNNKEGEKSKQLIAPASLFEIDFRLEEHESNFHLLSQICENATIYSNSSPSRAIPMRSQILDNLADLNGVAPFMFRLSKEEQLKVGNQACELIKSYVSSSSDVERLINGKIKMDQFRENITQESLVDKFQKLLESSKQNILVKE